GGIRFDWIMVGLLFWLLAGAYLDSWAHNHIATLDPLFTPWHAVLYAAFFAIAARIAGTIALNHRRGYSSARSLPSGYGLSLVGAGIFFVGGLGDAIWHTVFGVERDFAVVLSPSHLSLTFAACLMGAGPLRAAWGRSAPEDNHGWTALGPM